MHLSALLDFDVIPVDSDDHVTVLVDVTAPEQPKDAARPPATLQIVLDRSGSMGGARLEGAVRALLSLVDRLDPSDNFGLVTFDNQARVEVPAGPLADKDDVRRRIAAIRAGGSTDLSSGLLRGIQEARRASDRGATLLLVSDGHANLGITDHAALADCARGGYGSGITTTTLGYGLGYDEALLGAVADGGAGAALFAEDPDSAAALIAREAEFLLSKTAQAVSLQVRPGPLVAGVVVAGELPGNLLPDGSLMLELGDFYSGEQRRLLLRFTVPRIAALGTATVADLVATYADPATLRTYTATLPISVNVVPGDTAAGRVPNPTVRTEEAFQHAQTAKREASEALRAGDREGAAGTLERARRELAEQAAAAPPEQAGELTAQITELDQLARRARTDDSSRVSKAAYASQAGYTRQRARMADLTAQYLAASPGQAPPPPAPAGGPSAAARTRAALEGLSVGDAFGALTQRPAAAAAAAAIAAGALPPGPWRWTDETEMAATVVDVLLRTGRADQDELARLFAARFTEGRGYGPGARDLLVRIAQGADWRSAAAAQFGGTGSYGSGAAMRVAPLGAYFAGDPRRAAEEAARSAEVTHAHPEGVAGAVAVAVAASVWAGDPALSGEALLAAVAERVAPGGVRSGLERARALLGAGASEAARELGNGSRVSAPDTVPFALWAAAVHGDSVAGALRACVGVGGDTDTTAAMAGGVVAARTGVEGVPAEWRAAREPLPDWLPGRGRGRG
ncbi:ADP-ribosylglycohydrolase family protein [Streptomonospora sp. S1-112]|uniref:ADP-ribosylglycohydrolase family protein n=1 Tax=Streptomonospora mangrovi TaxID=2883123 RepID=A0A9X3SG45_9ACTN|nr:ADP-ribosylglycohydrolase family protein [Streptomonospora mangrovi]MDA0565590.1 ADP-ribosylglycohydrolase family protein [Streptomonospora mangrovi]